MCLTLNKAPRVNIDPLLPPPAAFIGNFCVFLLFLQALYNEYVHFKETEIPAKEMEKSHIQHLYKLMEVSVKRKSEMQKEKLRKICRKGGDDGR